MRLPRLNDLIPEQEKAYLLPLDGDYVVYGPPGTGKTVIALYRAGLTSDDDATLMLAHSKVLVHYMTGAAGRAKLAARTSTYDAWFCRLYKRRVGRRAPSSADDSWDYDWNTALIDLVQHPGNGDATPYLIIDEGQDMPNGFYTIVKTCARNVSVFADENQRLEHFKNSRISEIAAALGVTKAKGHLVELRYNHRNSRPIAELAGSLCVGLTGVADLPDRAGPKPVMRSWPNRTAVVENIAKMAKNSPKKTIGVLLPRKKQVRSFVNRLEAHLPGRKVQCYVSGDESCKATSLDFGDGVVTVLCYMSAKGLEFDTVFLPELETYWDQDPTNDVNRMLYYVLTSRARERLILGWTGTKRPRLVELFERKYFDWKG